MVLPGGKPQLQRQQERRWSEENTEKADPGLRRSANHRGLDGSNPFSFEQEQLLQQQQQQQQYSSSSSDPDFPLPWQGNIDLPASEEETMNAAQVGLRASPTTCTCWCALDICMPKISYILVELHILYSRCRFLFVLALTVGVPVAPQPLTLVETFACVDCVAMASSPI